MTLGTVFTLFVVPVFYSLIAVDRRAAKARAAEREERPFVHEAPAMELA